MALAFWGGFASGMSSSIEKNRDRKMREDKVKADEISRVNKQTRADDESVFNLKMKSEKSMADLQEDKRKVMSEDYDGTEETRIDTVNEINGKMFDVYKSANDRAVALGKPPIIDISNYDTGEMSTVNVDGEDYIVPRDLSATVAESDGNMKFVGNEIHQAVYEPNSVGQPIQKKDENGNVVFEPSGQALRKYSDVFKASKDGEGKSVLISDLPDTEQNKLIGLGYKVGDSITNAQRNKLVAQSSKGLELALTDGSVIYTEADGTPKLDRYGKKMYKSKSKEAKDLTEKSATMEGILNTLDRGYEVVVNDPNTVGSVGHNTADWIGNIINDILKIPTTTRLEREKLQQFTEPLASSMRSAVETGVMTDRDLKRYMKMLPQLDDSPESYKSKYNTLRKDIKSKYGSLKKAFEGEEKKDEIPVERTRQSITKDILASNPNARKEDIEKYLKSIGK